MYGSQLGERPAMPSLIGAGGNGLASGNNFPVNGALNGGAASINSGGLTALNGGFTSPGCFGAAHLGKSASSTTFDAALQGLPPYLAAAPGGISTLNGINGAASYDDAPVASGLSGMPGSVQASTGPASSPAGASPLPYGGSAGASSNYGLSHSAGAAYVNGAGGGAASTASSYAGAVERSAGSSTGYAQIIGREERPSGDGSSKSYVRIREIPAELVEAGIYRVKEPSEAGQGSTNGAAARFGTMASSNEQLASVHRQGFPTTGSFIAEPYAAREAYAEPATEAVQPAAIPAERIVTVAPTDTSSARISAAAAEAQVHGPAASRFEFPTAGSFVAEAYSEAGAPLYAPSLHGMGGPPRAEPLDPPPIAVARYHHDALGGPHSALPSRSPSPMQGRMSPMYGGAPAGDSFGGNRYALPPGPGACGSCCPVHPEEYGRGDPAMEPYPERYAGAGLRGMASPSPYAGRGLAGDTYSGGTMTYGLSPAQVAAGYGAGGPASHSNGYGAQGYGQNGYAHNGGAHGYPNSLGETSGAYAGAGCGLPGHGSCSGAGSYGASAGATYGFPTAGSFIAEPFAPGAPTPPSCQGAAYPGYGVADLYNGTSSPMNPPPFPSYGAGAALGPGPGFPPGPLGLGALGLGQGTSLPPGPTQASFLQSMESANPALFGPAALGGIGAPSAAGRLHDDASMGGAGAAAEGGAVVGGTPPKVRPPKDAEAGSSAKRAARSSKSDPVRGKKKQSFVGCC